MLGLSARASRAKAALPGQRWMSEAEPELGLGTVVTADGRSVVVQFRTSRQTRQYAVGSAPLRRIRFQAGDVVENKDGKRSAVLAVRDEDGLLVYACEDGEVAEQDISDRIALSGARERMFAGRIDAPEKFALRAETLAQLHGVRSSPVQGFCGARVELLPHQFYIAGEVASRRPPRVLLADETGLGKTIEACLAVNRLLATGRAERVLIVVPDSLVHQWLSELMRRFQLRFALLDEARCVALQEGGSDNPFLAEQLVLCALGTLTRDEIRAAQAADAGWDILVVDEAHHLVWHPTGPSVAYSTIEDIAECSRGLLLLSATPEQLGEESHFARLRLLDSVRYGDFEDWRDEANGYREVAVVGTRLAALTPGSLPDEADLSALSEALGLEPNELKRRLATAEGIAVSTDALLDRHGPGRVMFRNTRAVVSGFPERAVHLVELGPGEASATAESRAAAKKGRRGAEAVSPNDPRVVWLAERLRTVRDDKHLVICASEDEAIGLRAALQSHMNIDIALFHEGLSLVQRDRNAAWFADRSGARVLICSEIGSEGRNFQHAQHLVMFGLPLSPDLVEQRIGRLDRIGQRGTVHVHVPYVRGTGQEVFARWHHEGVGSLSAPTLISAGLLERHGETVVSVGEAPFDAAVLERLIAETKETAQYLVSQVEEGRDRLLEMSSLRPHIAAGLIEAVALRDDDPGLEDYFVRLLEHFQVYVEDAGTDCLLLNPHASGAGVLPGLTSGERVATLDRHTALVREDLEFVTWDYPLLGDAMEYLMASEAGNASFVLCPAEVSAPRLELEAIYVLETVSPPSMHAARFLAPTPIRVVTDQALVDVTSSDLDDFEPGEAEWIHDNLGVLRPLFEKMAARLDELAEQRALVLREQATASGRDTLTAELERIEALAAVNASVRDEEVAAVRDELEGLTKYLRKARLRLDGYRLIWRGPVRNGRPAAGSGRSKPKKPAGLRRR